MADQNELTNLDVIPLSGLTVQDIKDYIKKLSLEAGVMSKADITSYIEDIATGAGVQTQEELRNLIEQLAVEANVIPRTEIETLIVQEVLGTINNLNDNKDYINEVKDDILKDLDVVEAKLESTNTTTETNSASIHQIKNNLEYQYQKLSGSLSLVEASIHNIERSEDIINLIQTERENRILLDNTLNTKINNESKNLNIALDSKLSKEEFNTKLDLTNASLNSNINLKFSTVNNEVNTLQLDLQNQKSKLNTLLLDTNAFQEKLNILAELDSSDGATALGSLVSKIDDFEGTIQSATFLLNQVQTKVQDIDNGIQDQIQDAKNLTFDEISTRDKEVTRLDEGINLLKGNTQERLGLIKNEVIEFEEKTNNEILRLSDLISGINRTLGSEYQKVFDLIEAEADLRENNNKVLDLRITNEITEIYDRISEVDKSDDIISLTKAVDESAGTFKTLSNRMDGIKVELKNDLKLLTDKFQLNYVNNISRIDTEENIREAAVSNLTLKLDTEIATRIKDVQDINTSFRELKEKVLGSTLDGSNFSEDEKAIITSSISEYEADILKNYNDILSLRSAVTNIKIDLNTQVTSLNDSILDKHSIIQLGLTNEIDTRQTEVQSLNASIQELRNGINLINGTNTGTDSISSLKVLINDFNSANLALNVATINDIQNTTNALDVRVYNLELKNAELSGKLDSESETRESQYLLINERIDTLNYSIGSQLTALSTDIAEETTARQQDMSNLELSIQEQINAFEVQNNALQNSVNETISTINTRMDLVQAGIDSTTELLNESVAEIRTQINTETDERLSNDNALDQRLITETAERIQQDLDTLNLLNIEKARIDSILSGSDFDLDSFKEVIDFVNDLKAEKESALDGILTSLGELRTNTTNSFLEEAADREAEDARIDAKLDTEIGIREDAITEIDARILAEVQTRLDEVARIDATTTAKAAELVEIFNSIAENISTINLELNRVETKYKDSDNGLSVKITENLGIVRAELNTVHNELVDVDNEIKGSLTVLNATVIDNFQILDAKIIENENNFNAFIDGVPLTKQTLLNVYNELEASISLAQNNLDTVHASVNARMDSLELSINTEVNIRIAAIQSLSDALGNEIQVRNTLQEATDIKIDEETQARLAQVASLEQVVLNEINDRLAGDSELATSISLETQERLARNNEIMQIVNTEIQDRINQGDVISTNLTELDTKTAADKVELTAKIDAETALRESKVNELRNKIQEEIDRSIANDQRIDSIAQANKIALDSILANSTNSLNSFKELSDKIDLNKTLSNTNIGTLNTKILEVQNDLTARLSIEEDTRSTQNIELSNLIRTEILDRSTAFDNCLENIENAKEISLAGERTLQARIEQEGVLRESLITNTLARMDAEKANTESLHALMDNKLALSKAGLETQNIANLEVIQALNTSNASLEQALGNEVQARIEATQAVQDNVDQVNNIVQLIFNGVDSSYAEYAAIVELLKGIDITQEGSIANFASNVNASLTTLTTNLTAETNERLSQNSVINSLIMNETIARANNISTLNALISTEVQDRLSQVQVVRDEVQVVQVDLQNTLNASTNSLTALINDLSNEQTTIKDSIVLEVATLSAVDNVLRNDLETLETSLLTFIESTNNKISTETEERILDVQLLTEKINEEISTRDLQIQTDRSNLANETTNRIAGDTVVTNKIVRETADRALAIGIVDSKIDRIKVELGVSDNILNTKIDNVIKQTEAILAGTDINLAEFKDIVDILNNIDRENDVLACVQNTVSTSVANLTAMVETRSDTWTNNLNELETSLMDLVNTNNINAETTRNEIQSSLLNELDQNTNLINAHIDGVDSRISAEIINRQEHINDVRTLLNNNIDNEIQARVASILDLAQKLQLEVQLRGNAINSLDTKLSTGLDAEIQNRLVQEDSIREEINANDIKRLAAEVVIKDSIIDLTEIVDNNDASINTKLDLEIAERKQFDGDMIFDNKLKDINGDHLTNTTDAINSMVRSLGVLEIEIVSTIDSMIQDGRIEIPIQINEAEFFDRLMVDVRIVADERIAQEEARSIAAEQLLNDKFQAITDEQEIRITTAGVRVDELIVDVEQAREYATGLYTTETNRAVQEETAIRAEIRNLEAARDIQIDAIDTRVTDNRTSIQDIETDITSTKLATEAYRTALNIQIDQKIAVETERASTAEDVLETNLNNEITERANADSIINEQIAAILLTDADQTTKINDVTARVDGILADTSLELDSIKELIDYVNLNDTDITNTITEIISSTGLEVGGVYLADATRAYTATSTSIKDSIKLLDDALKAESTDNDAELLTLTQNLSTEVQARIDLGEAINLTVQNLETALRALITANTNSIASNLASYEENKILVQNLITALQEKDNFLQSNIDLDRLSTGLETDGTLDISGTRFIDSAISLKDSLITLDGILGTLQDDVGVRTDLNTVDKTNLVQSINEVNTNLQNLTAENEDAFNDAFLRAAGIAVI